MTGERDALSLEDFAMDHVVGRFAAENAGAKVRSEKLVPIGRGTVGRCDFTNGVGPIETPLWIADGKYAILLRVIGQHLPRVFPFRRRIRAKKLDRHKIVPEPIGIVISKPIAPIIPVPSELRLASD